MTRMPVHFYKVEDLIQFVNIVSRYNYDVELKAGDCTLDAKSLTGAIVLGSSKDLELLIHANDCHDLVENVARYV